tara:strand:+ start:23049 stop:23702 length:654 start_codon:yes stop_codon:yes gene_type:complete
VSEASRFPTRPKEESLFITSAGEQPVSLEARFSEGTKPWACVLCHPHPLHGGTMQNKVIDTALRGIAAEGFSTLRFNFRGAGKSEGTHGEGIAEVDDLRGAIQYMKERTQPEAIMLIGFSFGTGVISRYLSDGGECDGVVLLAPPLSMYALPTFEVPAKWGLHMFLGANDEFCDVASFRAHQHNFKGEVRAEVLEDAEHFFHGKLIELAEFVRGSVG